jgi:hypothetical protein
VPLFFMMGGVFGRGVKAMSEDCRETIFASDRAGAREGEFDHDLGAAGGAVAGGGSSGVGMGDGADEGQAEAVALGVAAFDEALQDAREKISGEARAVVFDDNAGG